MVSGFGKGANGCGRAGELEAAAVVVGDGEDAHAGGGGGLGAGRGVLEGKALGGRNTEGAGGREVDVRVGLVVRHVVAGDDSVEVAVGRALLGVVLEEALQDDLDLLGGAGGDDGTLEATPADLLAETSRRPESRPL